MEAMLRALLADRFQLVAHVEPREQDVYGLYLASGDRRLGTGTRAAALDCVELVEKRPALPPRANGAPACGIASDAKTVVGRNHHGAVDSESLAHGRSRHRRPNESGWVL